LVTSYIKFSHEKCFKTLKHFSVIFEDNPDGRLRFASVFSSLRDFLRARRNESRKFTFPPKAKVLANRVRSQKMRFSLAQDKQQIFLTRFSQKRCCEWCRRFCEAAACGHLCKIG